MLHLALLSLVKPLKIDCKNMLWLVCFLSTTGKKNKVLFYFNSVFFRRCGKSFF